MLHISELTFRIEGRTILDRASAAIPAGHKVGLVGRNGAGKSTLFRLLVGEVAPDEGTISLPRGARIGHVAQEAPGGAESIHEWVLSADRERTRLLREAETASDPARIAHIQERLFDIGAHSAPARAAAILSGLGFDTEAQLKPCQEFSGGWRMRVALAAVLFLEPDLLLLDEPTNYLDLEGTLWLENHLRSYPHTVLIISHDRDLLNRAVGSILHLERGRLTLYTGGYDDFEETRREQQRREQKLLRRQEDERKRIEAFITRFKAKASKASQAQSRMKALQRMKPIAAAVDETVAPIRLPPPARLLASPLIRLEDASVGYDPTAPVLSRLNLNVDQDDRIALLGANGNGKSTFAKLIAGRLPTTHGRMITAPRLIIGYFAQHQLDELDSARTPYELIREMLPTASEAERRAKLGQWGFSSAKADTRTGDLSGGEKARLLLALTAQAAPHLLILDEPTNHLDVDSRESLIQALNEFPGAVIVISHDRHLIEATVDRLWVVRHGTVSVYEGDLDSYRAELLAERGQQQRNERRSSSNADTASRADQRRRSAERRAELAPLRQATKAAEKRLESIGARLAEIDAALADPASYADATKAQQLAIERSKTARELAAAEEAWLIACEALEQAEAGVS